MAEGNRFAIDDLGVPAEMRAGGRRLTDEGLIGLDQIEIGD